MPWFVLLLFLMHCDFARGFLGVDVDAFLGGAFVECGMYTARFGVAGGKCDHNEGIEGALSIYILNIIKSWHGNTSFVAEWKMTICPLLRGCP